MALAQLSNLSASNYFRSAATVLGGNTSFTASILLIELGPTSATQFICGNRSGNSGWCFERLGDSNNGATHNYTFTVYENAVAQTVTFAIPGSVGKMMLFDLVYAAGAPGAQTVLINGIEMVTEATSSNAITLSSGRFSIGYDANAAGAPNPDLGFVAFAFSSTAYTSTALAENTLAAVKAQQITSSNLAPGWTHLYSVARDSGSGVPSTLRNFGTGSAAQTLEVLGRANMSLSSPAAFLGDSVRIASSGGGGDVSGPGASTNTAIVLWNGVTGTDVMDSLVLIDGSGNVTQPALATVDGRDISVDGTKLDTIATGATNTPLSAVAPVDVTKAAAAVGVAVTAARSDHKHDITTAAAGAITVGAAAAEGVATSLARSDHTHSLAAPAAPANVTKSAASAGAAVTVARADHKHDVTTAAAVSVTSATNGEGVATSLARSDHTHAHGDLLGGTLHAAATTLVAGFMTPAQVTKLDSIPGSSTAIYDIYVSAVNGNDANDGSSPGDAVQTLTAVATLLPQFPTAAVIIHFGSGTYAWVDFLTARQNSNAPIYLIGDGAGQPGDDGFTIAVSQTAGLGSTAINVLAATASDNLRAGYTIEFTAGALTGQRKTIRSNTTTALVPSCAFSGAPTAGDAFDIKSSAVIFSIPDGANIGAGVGYSQSESPLVLINLNFQGSGFDTSLRVASSHVVMYGVSFEEGAFTCVDSTIHAGTLYANAADPRGAFGNFLPFQGTVDPLTYLTQQLSELADSDNVFNWEGWGLSCLRDTDEQLPLVMDSGLFVGFLVAAYLTVSPAAKVELVGGSVISNGQSGSGIVINNGGYVHFLGLASQRDQGGTLTLPGIAFTVSTGVTTRNGGYTQIDALASTTVSITVSGPGSICHVPGTGAGVTGRGAVTLTDGALLYVVGAFTGTGSLSADDVSQCVFDTAANQIALTAITLANGSKLYYQGSAVGELQSAAISVTENSEMVVRGPLEFTGNITLVDSVMTVDTNVATAPTTFGLLVSLERSKLVVDYNEDLTINSSGGVGDAALTLEGNSTFIKEGAGLDIIGLVDLSEGSYWSMAGGLGTSSANGLTVVDSRVNISGSGAMTFTDTVAISLIGSEFKVSDLTTFTSAGQFVADYSDVIFASVTDVNIGTTGISLFTSDLLQNNTQINVTGGILMSKGALWSISGAMGSSTVTSATDTWIIQSSTLNMISTTGTFDVSIASDNGLRISAGGVAYVDSAQLTFSGAAAVAAINTSDGGSIYFAGALVAFGSTGDDFADTAVGADNFAFSSVNTLFGAVSGAAFMPGNHTGGTWSAADHAIGPGSVMRIS